MVKMNQYYSLVILRHDFNYLSHPPLSPWETTHKRNHFKSIVKYSETRSCVWVKVTVIKSSHDFISRSLHLLQKDGYVVTTFLRKLSTTLPVTQTHFPKGKPDL